MLMEIIMIIILFLLLKTQNFPVLTLSAMDNQKLSKLLSKGFERSVYWNEYKTKSDDKNTINEFRFYLESNFVGVSRLFVLVYKNQDAASKRFKAKRYYLPNGVIDNFNIIINGKNFYDQAIDSDLKQYEGIRKLTTGQGGDYTIGCLLDYEYIKSHYRLIAVDLSRQNELGADPKAIQLIEFVGQLKNVDGINVDGTQKMFVLIILEKIKETRLKFPQGTVAALQKMANYQEVRVKLTNTQLYKLKSAAKNKTNMTNCHMNYF